MLTFDFMQYAAAEEELGEGDSPSGLKEGPHGHGRVHHPEE